MRNFSDALRMLGGPMSALVSLSWSRSGILWFALLSVVTTIPAAAQERTPGIGSVTVHSQLGGQIFGFDVEANGTEGLLTEAQTLANGNTLNAVETFDQATGKI